MRLTPERIALLRKIKRKIRKFPGSFNQGEWHTNVATDIAPCGTACCIAGWACLLSGKYEERYLFEGAFTTEVVPLKRRQPTLIRDSARRLLGLSNMEAHVLFNGAPGSIWPEPFAKEWNKTGRMGNARRLATRADIACRYIDYIIKKGAVGYYDY